jgi:hypothetical protein
MELTSDGKFSENSLLAPGWDASAAKEATGAVNGLVGCLADTPTPPDD